jgi:hypothetical protein
MDLAMQLGLALMLLMGLPLAAAIKAMGRPALHLGGALQLLFGIRGRRWEGHAPLCRPDERSLGAAPVAGNTGRGGPGGWGLLLVSRLADTGLLPLGFGSSLRASAELTILDLAGQTGSVIESCSCSNGLTCRRQGM